MFLLFNVMEILWTIFSSSCSLGGSVRPKMPSEAQWSPPKMHFRVKSLADQGDSQATQLRIRLSWRMRHLGNSCIKVSLVQQLSLENLLMPPKR